MNKYRDIFTIDNGVFKYMVTLNPTLYKQLFNDLDSAVLDNITYFNNGDKTLYPIFTDATDPIISSVLKSIFYVYGNKWEKYKNILDKEYSVTEHKETETLTGNDSTDKMQNVTDVDSNKAFDSIEFAENDKTHRQTDDSNTREYNHTKTTVKENANIPSDINKELVLRGKYNLYIIIINDIINNITLKIYE